MNKNTNWSFRAADPIGDIRNAMATFKPSNVKPSGYIPPAMMEALKDCPLFQKRLAEYQQKVIDIEMNNRFPLAWFRRWYS